MNYHLYWSQDLGFNDLINAGLFVFKPKISDKTAKLHQLDFILKLDLLFLNVFTFTLENTDEKGKVSGLTLYDTCSA